MGNPVYKFFVEIDETISRYLYSDEVINGQDLCVTSKMCDRLTPISLAIWYMDDGNLKYHKNLNTYSIQLSTNSFDRKENELLINCLKDRFNIDNVNLIYDRARGYFSITINGNGVDQFFNLVKNYIHPDLHYKLKPEYLNNEFVIENIRYSKEERLTENIIEDIRIIPKEDYKKWVVSSYVYDIEVADNHNFFANDILNHNCENMPWVLQDKTPYIVTQKCDGTSATYILERKKHDKYEFYVCSRNVRQMNEDQECYHSTNVYWEMEHKYDIKNKLTHWLERHMNSPYICWQGEICGPDIQKNPQALSERHFFAFHMIDENGKYDMREAKKIWDSYGIETVPIMDENYIMPDDFEEFKLQADGCYDPSVCEGKTDCPREGYVYYKTTDPNFSFKNVSREYLLNH